MTGERTVATEFDLSELAPRIVQASAAVATGRLRLASPRDTLERLVNGDAEVIAQFRNELAHQIGSTLIWMDPHVIAVYQDPSSVPNKLDAPLCVIVHVENETAALRNLIPALGDALREAELDGLRPLRRMPLEAAIVDERSLRLADRGYLVVRGDVEPLVAR
ncbi:MAG TPA: hypothetical protein VKZ96_16295 [Thermomicrobiales bacterium]|nr:hypothetical protein [Thermomicrobiales bacterium]